MTPPLVFKLGGSSVSSIGSLHHFSDKLTRCRHAPVLVVVSALSKVTDQLEALTAAAVEGRVHDGDALLEGLRVRHLQMIGQLIPAEKAPEAARAVAVLLAELDAARSRPAPSQAELRDRLLPYGERMSSVLVTAHLAHHLGDARCIDARTLLRTDSCFGAAEPLREASLQLLENNLRPFLTPGSVVVTQGFCGATADGRPTTLGRGGSDFSATYLGALLDASEIEIRTDTPGVLSADPRKITGTRIVRRISRRRASTLAHFGAKVLHQRCIEPVLGTDIAVRVLSSFDPDDPGTLIGEDDEPGAFSVTYCRAWLHTIVRPDALTASAFVEAVARLGTRADVLALAHDGEAARLITSKGPEAAPFPEHLAGSAVHHHQQILFVMAAEPGPERLICLLDALRLREVPVQVAFTDTERGGYVLAVAEHQIEAAAIVVHRTLLRPTPVPVTV